MEPDMGLSEEDTQLLVENVAVVFHLAATIRFDEPIRYTPLNCFYFNTSFLQSPNAFLPSPSLIREALQMNVLGVRKVIKLCKMLKKLVVSPHTHTHTHTCLELIWTCFQILYWYRVLHSPETFTPFSLLFPSSSPSSLLSSTVICSCFHCVCSLQQTRQN